MVGLLAVGHSHRDRANRRSLPKTSIVCRPGRSCSLRVRCSCCEGVVPVFRLDHLCFCTPDASHVDWLQIILQNLGCNGSKRACNFDAVVSDQRLHKGVYLIPDARELSFGGRSGMAECHQRQDNQYIRPHCVCCLGSCRDGRALCSFRKSHTYTGHSDGDLRTACLFGPGTTLSSIYR